VKLLLDENVPHKLRAHLARHETITVAYMGWGGLKNGELLKAAERAGFDVFVTGDRSLEYEQNVTGLKVAVVSLSAHNWPIIKNHLAKIVAAIDGAQAGSFSRVDCGVFSRRGSKPKEPSAG
jgi:predicted nuclease of predicted toxin-antitoxin system